jgi:hypothetical protein
MWQYFAGALVKLVSSSWYACREKENTTSKIHNQAKTSLIRCMLLCDSGSGDSRSGKTSFYETAAVDERLREPFRFTYPKSYFFVRRHFKSEQDTVKPPLRASSCYNPRGTVHASCGVMCNDVIWLLIASVSTDMEPRSSTFFRIEVFECSVSMCLLCLP